MERKIGEIFEFGGEWYQCVKGIGCFQCVFNRTLCVRSNISRDIIGNCSKNTREDGYAVIFKKLEKVGEPYSDYCPSGRVIYFQRYKCYQKPIIEENIIWHWADDTLIDLEIKQNKKDMEEKKLNLKPFNLEKAKAGKTVCTRDGRKARIICFDAKYNDNYKPLIVLIDNGKNEFVVRYTKNGECSTNDDFDLMMLPERKEGWVNVYYDNDTSSHRGCRFIYDTKEQAIKSAGEGYITTIKIEWEE